MVIEDQLVQATVCPSQHAEHNELLETIPWGGQEFREIRFEICYAVHFFRCVKFRAKFDMLTISLEPKFASVGREGHRMGP